MNQIKKCFAQRMGEGMLTLVVANDENNGKVMTDARPNLAAIKVQTNETNVLLSQANTEQAKTLLSKLQDKTPP